MKIILVSLLCLGFLTFGMGRGYDWGVRDGIARVGICEYIKDWPKYIAEPRKSLEECKP